ncbi:MULTISPECIES: 4-aminobutyrate--2-oxoglutarate transaminase [unclassified Sphingobium]|uniref:4-aminobutyrate--2-oxoglutarate transaminase n=1 Tax=unclassified Sphingobium TaxID=2611147 RepID=UPI002224CEE4|nr:MULTISPECIES: 4-aminobutyrate--2-oxoglutarate transaminase [unclassified Sphingobium]MCW2395770.1 4-aminobutyrate aminotransferase/(S)-3-amino-2-methylpropionate transaminase [Sphingobium sp. B8D3B]MCW2419285.1 4-aminobutyrate aminotransferase/(S)-3-amino-2-methylpropionate transaminase [Sphingobium sp. B8D3C]
MSQGKLLNSDLMQRRVKAVPRGVASATSIFAERASNSEIWDVEGRRYVDFAGGIAVLNVGHLHPRVVEAVQTQLGRFSHTAFQVMGYDVYVELAERLNALAPFDGEAQTIFFTTGAEATENAVKIARAATKRSAVISFTGGFHGRSALANAMTGKVNPYKWQFGPSVPDVFHVPFPNPSYDVSVEDSLKALDFIFSADVAPQGVAAIILEPVQGEGGFHVAPPELLKALREICDTHGIKLIADEVQSGIARTGRMFAIEHAGVQPDLVTVAKSLAGGFPLSGVIGRAELMDMVEPGGLGGTYGGSPIGCAAALAVLDVIEEEGLLSRADVIGNKLRTAITAWSDRNDLVRISQPRGLGSMIGFDVLDPDNGLQSLLNGGKLVANKALEHGLVVLNCGGRGETVRILVPLTASDDILDEGLRALEAALSSVA